MSVREDVYEALRRLSEVSNATMSDLIRQLLTAYLAINEIRELLKQCLDKSTPMQALAQPKPSPLRTRSRRLMIP